MEEGRRPAAVENIFTGRPAAPRSPRIFSEMPKAPSQEEIVRSLQTQYLDGMRKMSINNMNNWDYIKSEKANNVVGWLRNGGHPNDTKLAEEVNKMMRGFEHDLGAKGRPGRGESVAKWLERVIREKTRMEVEKMKKAA